MLAFFRTGITESRHRRAFFDDQFKENDITNRFFFDDLNIVKQTQLPQCLHRFLNIGTGEFDFFTHLQARNTDNRIGVSILDTCHFDTTDFIVFGFAISHNGQCVLSLSSSVLGKAKYVYS